MLTEKGTLPVGVEFEGKVHQEFELREQLVSDMVDVFDNEKNAERAQKNAQFFSACLLTGRLTKLGDIPKEQITVDLLLGMNFNDYGLIIDAGKRLEVRESTFRQETAGQPETGAGAA